MGGRTVAPDPVGDHTFFREYWGSSLSISFALLTSHSWVRALAIRCFARGTRFSMRSPAPEPLRIAYAASAAFSFRAPTPISDAGDRHRIASHANLEAMEFGWNGYPAPAPLFPSSRRDEGAPTTKRLVTVLPQNLGGRAHRLA